MQPPKPKIAIIFYSMYGHVLKLASAEKQGIEGAGGSSDLFQIDETLSKAVLDKMAALDSQLKEEIPHIKPEDMKQYDAFLFGVPTRFGNMPGQWKVVLHIEIHDGGVTGFQAFWDKTGKLWKEGSLAGKYAGIFFSTSTLGGGQEMTASSMMSTLVHHGIIYVPFGYSQSFHLLGNLNEVHGGSAWGAGTLSGPDNSRLVSEVELDMATLQGKQFYEILSKVKFSSHEGVLTA
ncbi:hypothetical protein APHAL10511_000861 [Amanita phalloides]|nr:hypothetical protein APHAL10511_000861 [Amanita phalloides]